MRLGLAALLISGAVACEEEKIVECDREHVTDPEPAAVGLTEVEATDRSLTFRIAPENALAVYYAIYESDAALPTAEQLFDRSSSEWGGVPADATVSECYTFDNLELGTTYTIVAAARNKLGYSETASLEMTTLIPEMSLSLSQIDVKASSVSFSITPVNASKVAYMVVPGSDVPDAAVILSEGTEADATQTGTYKAGGLQPETEYTVVAAALDLAGKGTLAAEPLNITTPEMPAPAVGDFYYADGTWSAELDMSKTPIGVVFYLGVATDFGDSSAHYKVKDGSAPLETFHGYAVALRDATETPEGNNGVAWSFYDGWYDGAGCSSITTDFLGYTNTKSIEAAALVRPGALTADSDSFPATYYATIAYEEAYPAPAESSGWFLPSAGQLKYIWDSVYFNPDNNLVAWLENSFEQLGDAAAPMYTTDALYWSSTEKYDAYACSYYAYYVNFDSSNFSPGFISDYTKNREYRVRSILVF